MAGFRRAEQLLLLVFVVASTAVLAAGSLRPLSEADKESAKQLFVAKEDGSYGRYFSLPARPSAHFLVKFGAVFGFGCDGG